MYLATVMVITAGFYGIEQSSIGKDIFASFMISKYVIRQSVQFETSNFEFTIETNFDREVLRKKVVVPQWRRLKHLEATRPTSSSTSYWSVKEAPWDQLARSKVTLCNNNR